MIVIVIVIAIAIATGTKATLLGRGGDHLAQAYSGICFRFAQKIIFCKTVVDDTDGLTQRHRLYALIPCSAATRPTLLHALKPRTFHRVDHARSEQRM
jgi:hypothetical protein